MFEGKVVLVTGGASGLGRILVKEFSNLGAKVVFTYLSSVERAEKICQELGDNVAAIQANASSYDEAEKTVKFAVETFGKIDILINNAASAKDGSLERLTYEQFDYTLKNVLYPIYNYCHAAYNELCKNKGKIINIGSVNGLRGREGSLAYSTAKAGIVGFTKTIAKEMGKYNVTCNVVAPGYIATDGQERTSELIKKLVLDECAIRHLVTPEEVTELVVFLASHKADSITGHVYQIDCGQYI